MKSTKAITDFENEVEIDGKPYYVIAELHWDCYTDGIGSYEYWGQKCYDEGSFCADLENIEIKSIVFADDETETNIEISNELKEKIFDYIAKVAEYEND